MLPHVIIHNAVSLDGRMDWFMPNVALYYELAGRWPAEAILSGVDTFIAAYASQPPTDEGAESPAPPPNVPNDTRPLLFITDSRGRGRHYVQLCKEPYWRGVVVLGSASTPRPFLDNLDRNHIGHIEVGEDRVDLRSALELIHTRYGVKQVRVDSGGALNGALLRAGLVAEVSVLIDPVLVGGTTPRSLFRADDLTCPEDVIPLKLTHLERMQDDIVWLRYEVGKDREVRL